MQNVRTMKRSLKVYCDTNVYLDILKDDRECAEVSREIMGLLHALGITPYLSTQSIIDASYIMCKGHNYGIDKFIAAFRITKAHFDVVSITSSDILVAEENPNWDFEDTAQMACAARLGCEAILSSDKDFKNQSKVPVYTPREFLAKITGAN